MYRKAHHTGRRTPAFFNAALLLSLFTICVDAQTPAPKGSPKPDNDVVKISTNLIQLDVTVVDGKGKVVRDVRPEEIEIYENGEKPDCYIRTRSGSR